MRRKRILAVVLLLGVLAAPPTLADTILLEDNFDTENGGSSSGNYFGFANWNVANGTVDLIATGGWGITCAGGNGMCVDLDGSTDSAGQMESKEVFNLEIGTYKLSFDLSGNQRKNSTDTVQVSLGDIYSESFTKEGSAPFETINRTISVETSTSATLIFDHTGGDNYGLILDNVILTKLKDGPPLSTLTIEAPTGSGTLIIKAKPSKGWKFKEWAGDCKGKKKTKVKMDSDKHCAAVFEPK
jgi:hypothetical protein